MEKPNVVRKPIELDLKQTTPIACDSCKAEAFQEALMLRRVSPLVTGNGKEGVVPLQVFVCAKCGHVNNQFLPEGLRSNIIPV